jgi:ferritin-like metal-binding protein YciE
VKPLKAFSKKAKKSSKTIGTAPALDAELLAAGQAVEHYAIARYGTPKNWAAQIGLKDASALPIKKQ